MCSIQDLASQGKQILAVGAHWDDIELGCGLALTKLIQRGWKVWGGVLTDSAYAGSFGARTCADAKEEGLRAFQELGIFPIEIEPALTQNLSYNTEQMKRLEDAVCYFEISLAFVPWPGDFNTDHEEAAKICRVAARYVPSVLYYRSNGYYDSQRPFVPNLFVGGTNDDYEQKIKLFRIHQSEYAKRKERWKREIIARDRYWGSFCGCDYAEGFVVSRMRLL